MELPNRPLSPHLQAYKLPLTGLISITHRITGIVLVGGLLAFVYSFWVIATSEPHYLSLQNSLNHPLVSVMLILFVYALFFHFCHGVRHLIWDTGASFEKKTMTQYAVMELIASLVLTVISILFL